MTTKSPAVDAAKNVKVHDNNTEAILADGRKAHLVPVSAALIDEVSRSVKYPSVPVWHNPDKDRDEENPSDPVYIRAVIEIDHSRSIAGMDAMVMFGVELVEGLPEDDAWMKKLQFMDKKGMINLKDYDLDDPIEREFLYKRYYAVTTDIYDKIGRLSGITQEEVNTAEESFPGN